MPSLIFIWLNGVIFTSGPAPNILPIEVFSARLPWPMSFSRKVFISNLVTWPLLSNKTYLDTIPPLWAVNLHKGRCYYGSNFYLDLENLLISIERGLDLYPNYHVPEADSDFLGGSYLLILYSFSVCILEHLHPYQLPHLIPGTECLQRVNRAGSVVYASEEKADLSTMSDVIPLQQGLSVPPCAADHSQFVAHLTTNHRPHQSNIGRSKLYVRSLQLRFWIPFLYS